jgi:hypothetical protein
MIIAATIGATTNSISVKVIRSFLEDGLWDAFISVH